MINQKICSQILGGYLSRYKTYLAGNYKGFYIVITPDSISGLYQIKINAFSETDPSNVQLASYLEQCKVQTPKILKVQTGPCSFELDMKVPNLARNIPGAVNEAVDLVIYYLIDNRYISGCGICGKTSEPLHCYEINGSNSFLCEECAQNVNESLRKRQQDIQMQKSNLPAGLIGALAGALIGGALWILIYKLGYIAGIAGAVTGILAMKGYELLGKCLDKKGVVCSVIIMFLVIYLANRLSWAWEVYDAYGGYFGFSYCFAGLRDFLIAADATASYYGDLAIGFVLTLLCSYKNIASSFRASTGSYTMKKH